MPDSVCSIYQEGTTGSLTSVNSPGTATTIDCRNFSSGLIAIRNSGATNTLQYSIASYANVTPSTAGVADVATTDIAPNTTVTYAWSNAPRASRIVTIIPKVGGSQSTYIIEHCLGV